MSRYRLAKLVFWIGVGIILGLLVNSLASCGPTPQPYVVQPAQVVQATPVSVQQQAVEDVSRPDCEWAKITNPVPDCSARKLVCKSALGAYMDCVFIRCGTNITLSCADR